jgi:hypothetical protein
MPLGGTSKSRTRQFQLLPVSFIFAIALELMPISRILIFHAILVIAVLSTPQAGRKGKDGIRPNYSIICIGPAFGRSVAI